MATAKDLRIIQQHTALGTPEPIEFVINGTTSNTCEQLLQQILCFMYTIDSSKKPLDYRFHMSSDDTGISVYTAEPLYMLYTGANKVQSTTLRQLLLALFVEALSMLDTSDRQLITEYSLVVDDSSEFCTITITTSDGNTTSTTLEV